MKPMKEPRGGIDQLLGVEEVADCLKLSVRSVRRLISRKELSVIRIGRSVRVRLEDLNSFIDEAARSALKGPKTTE
jgi:excisionase family DNA binding protein